MDQKATRMLEEASNDGTVEKTDTHINDYLMQNKMSTTSIKVEDDIDKIVRSKKKGRFL